MSRLKTSQDEKQNNRIQKSLKKHRKQKQVELAPTDFEQKDLTRNDIAQNDVKKKATKGKRVRKQNGLTPTERVQGDPTQNDGAQNQDESEKRAVRVRKKSRYEKIVAKTGKTRILVYGRNSVRAVHAISKAYRVENVVNKSDGVEFSVQSKHCGKIIALLDNLCYNYKIIKIYGILPRSLLILSRAGIFVGLACAIVATTIYTAFITRVSVDFVGDDVTLNERAFDILSSYGIDEGCRIANADVDGARYGLLALDGVSFVSIERNGTHFKVTVKAVENDIFVDIAGSSVVAQKQAVVDRIVVESGTAVKKHGDVVKPGDVLIDGYIEYGDEKIPVQASGYAYGRVYYEKSVVFLDTTMKKSYGRQKTITKLSMFGKTPNVPDSPFEQSECKVSVAQFGFLLPFEIYEYTFYEVIVEEEQNELTEDQMKMAVYAQIVEEFPSDVKVLDRIFEIERKEDGYIVDVTVETEERI